MAVKLLPVLGMEGGTICSCGLFGLVHCMVGILFVWGIVLDLLKEDLRAGYSVILLFSK